MPVRLDPHPSRKTIAAAASCLAATILMAGFARSAPPLPREIDPIVQNIDPSVSPGADFFQYACGGWIKKNPIPPSERGWGIATLVREESYRQLREICEDAARSGASAGTSEQKVGDLWVTGMDSVRIDRLGISPIRPYLAEIAAVRTKPELLTAMAHLRTLGIGSLYSMFVDQDNKNSVTWST